MKTTLALTVMTLIWVVSFALMIVGRKKDEIRSTEKTRTQRWDFFLINLFIEVGILLVVSGLCPKPVIFLFEGLMLLVITSFSWQIFGYPDIIFILVKLASILMLAITQVGYTGWLVRGGFLLVGIILTVKKDFVTRSIGVPMILFAAASIARKATGLPVAGNIAWSILALIGFISLARIARRSWKKPGFVLTVVILVGFAVVTIANMVTVVRFLF